MRTLMVRTSRFVATLAVAAAALATACTSGATATPTTQPAAAGDSTVADSTPAESTPADSTPAGSPPDAGEPDLLAFSQCMRDNGIADFPDPGPDGLVVDGLDIDPESPQFKAAEEACNYLMPPSDSTAPSGSGAAGESDWVKVLPGGDCECADGSEFAFWERRADPTKVVFWLDGGGGCWDATTCAFTDEDSTTYDWNVSPDDDPALEEGIFDRSDPDNPFADYTFVYLPYCTGDVHLGDVTREYSPDLTVEHNGFVNGSTALAYLVEHYPDADQVVVAGESAGSVAAPVYAGLVSDALPDAQITVLADGSGALDVNAEILGMWGTFDTMPDWEVNEGLTAQDWRIPRFSIQAGLHDPDIVMARFDYAYDEVQTSFMELLGEDTSNLVASIDANEATIEDAGVVQHGYTAPGDDHGIVGDGPFYEIEVNGVTLVDWVDALLAGEPLDDVHCEDCETP
jgi:Pectinacetylesterase